MKITLSKGMFTGPGSNRGVALVYIAIFLVVLLAFVGLAIDIGYMYVAKTELQNAADSAALAGASKLKYVGPGGANPYDLVQSAGRAEAIAFAELNKATKIAIAIENDDSNTLGSDNDITVGHWNGAAYSPDTTPVNAIQVRPRRTSDAPGGEVSLFISRVFGWDTMGVKADAIAALPVRATSFIALCIDACTGVSSDPANPDILSPPRILDRNPTVAGETQFAWTSLLIQTTSTPEITALVCSENPNEQVCDKSIYTSQGTNAAGIKDLEAVFNDPNFDSSNKEYSGTQVIAWWVIVPVTESCPVTSQGIGTGTEPKRVISYALVRIISACDQGGGQGSLCRNYQSPSCPLDYRKKIVIDRIACISCANISNLSGLKTVLVK